MAARAYWSGRIRLALVSIPVEVVPATKSAARIAFHQVHEPSGKRIRYEKVVPGIGPVDTDDIVKGYEVEKGKYVLLTDEEIADVKLEAKKTVDLVHFVDADAIDPIYFERPYYVLPQEEDEDGVEAYAVLRDALKETKKVGLGQIVVRGQGSIVAIKPCGKGLLLETLRYADEVRTASRWVAIGSALALTWLNPHVYLDTVLTMGAIANSHGNAKWAFAIGACAASVLWFTLIGRGGSRLAPLFAKPRAWKILDGIVAVIMVGMGAALLFSA